MLNDCNLILPKKLTVLVSVRPWYCFIRFLWFDRTFFQTIYNWSNLTHLINVGHLYLNQLSRQLVRMTSSLCISSAVCIPVICLLCTYSCLTFSYPDSALPNTLTAGGQLFLVISTTIEANVLYEWLPKLHPHGKY